MTARRWMAGAGALALVGGAVAGPAVAAPGDGAQSEGQSALSQSGSSYSFEGTSGKTRMFILSSYNSDAILLESNGWFGIIDGGEDADTPYGSDPRYPERSGIAASTSSTTEWLLEYLDDQGVTDSNVAFYLGTHAHSDHIGNADEIIRRYRPKLIFSPEYSDEWITDESGLWDNQYVYDHLVEAAQWARSEYGAQFIQELDGYSTHVRMGDMDVQMIPFDVDEVYKRQGTTDANLMGWGAKVSAFGRSAFLAADLMDTDSDWTTHNGFEGRISSEVGSVDILKAGHHGQESSNFEEFLGALAPSTIIQTGLAEDTPDRLTRHAIHGDGLWFPMGDIWDSVKVPALVCEFSDQGIAYAGVDNARWGHEYTSETPRAWWFHAGHTEATAGWWQGPSENWYYFDSSASAVHSEWRLIDGYWYFFDESGALASREEGQTQSASIEETGSGSSPSPLVWAAGAGLLVVAAGGAWWALRSRGHGRGARA
ncbi:MBL fold metallo-hydrolase [Schaalia georgiae]|nr:MBL fold metallo-hydrolase [Schaalia georgiae]